jgi:Flp pilus assembly pilin Flp
MNHETHQDGNQPTPRRDLGQATAEYALVLLGAAAIAMILLGWATGGGNRIGGLLDQVMNAVTGRVK